MPPKEKYTDPKLRDQVKEEIHAGDKGGQPGQWSARKAQMMASEYKKRGGDYNTDKSQQDESQKNLSKWGEEDWQTKEGSGNAKQDDGTEKRYLPKKAWENMTESEKEETDQQKQEASKKGQQHVGNTKVARESRQKANEEESKKYENKKAQEQEQKGDVNDEQEEDGEEGGDYVDDDEANDDEDGEEEVEAEDGAEGGDSGDADGEIEHEDQENAKPGQKRKQSTKSSNGPSKSQKTSSGKASSTSNGTVGSKHQPAEELAPRGSADRLPKKGQKVQWKALPGYVDGEVVEIVTESKEVDGKSVKASEDDPRIVLKSSSSGKIAVHKPETCFFE